MRGRNSCRFALGIVLRPLNLFMFIHQDHIHVVEGAWGSLGTMGAVCLPV